MPVGVSTMYYVVMGVVLVGLVAAFIIVKKKGKG
ncbi:MAG: LPXTG cell wall anchor domain-containing protein [Planctomycetes bacterium]|nr:LPXTG cell wall anchor domain-containing protein [Planctomycetota bacterium]